ncbi:alcohol dehydrogenase catalytic domain-containing protein [Devosia algicola]|uniref:Alcohol dehydrogenase catalytic domain-containing protein n=1 Tax=Devosia algicola TaxID=3026418 RepID=A0ABY7YQM7_9HYPH|nr:alcohol dehydrogenase catalytic domain-containing protein [Devosia algicola]WDR03559.1 alcohol dehydrogenase catalytic domain-containing protein [Devosia algicola]
MRLHFETRAIPQPGHGEALVEVKAAGVCAGDLYIYKGNNPYVVYPRVGGHEIAGVVSALGPGASGHPIGQRVVVEPFIGCGKCYACRVGKSNCCSNLQIIGIHRDGGFADYVVAPIDRLHPIPDGLTDFQASLCRACRDRCAVVSAWCGHGQ